MTTDTPSDTLYRHSQTYTLLWLIDAVLAAICVPMVLGTDDTSARGGIALVLGVLLALPVLLGRLVIRVDAQAVHWHFGYVGWPAWSQPLKGIGVTEVSKANVYFGSGIKGGQLHRQYNVTMNGPALRLHLADGRKITLGTPEPQRLQAVIEARLTREMH
ncbi:MAG: hypothetical protein ACOVOG_05995 [Rubrivivax sp.]|jgi:hypothetical protein|nr:hypothetical protein [Rubrivivax sp.]